jgi:hypothetical protein
LTLHEPRLSCRRDRLRRGDIVARLPVAFPAIGDELFLQESLDHTKKYTSRVRGGSAYTFANYDRGACPIAVGKPASDEF